MTGKNIAILLIATAIILTITSLFLFAIGWDKLKSYSESGTVSGIITLPKVPIKYEPTMYLIELFGDKKRYDIIPNNEGSFILKELDPGEYNLIIEGQHIKKITQKLEVITKTNTNIGTIQLEFSAEESVVKINSPNLIIQHMHINDQNAIWLLGGNKDSNNITKYKIYLNENNTQYWNEEIIPLFDGTVFALFCGNFSGNYLIIGSEAKGAVISNNNGLIWSKLDLPVKVNFINNGLEVANGSWILMGREEHGTGVLVLSNDNGISWKTVLNADHIISSGIIHSSGRLLVSTESLEISSSIFYSDDNGSTWSKSKFKDGHNLRGIKCLYELRNGSILAGTMSGLNWKGDFHKSSKILISKDCGLTWSTLYDDPSLTEISYFYESKNGILYIWGNQILCSFDIGKTWHIFYGQPKTPFTFKGYLLKSEYIFFTGISGVYKINIDDLDKIKHRDILI